MKKLLVLLFTILLSFNSFGDWKWIGDNANSNDYYIDFEKIKKVDGYKYYWFLTDLLKPDKDGDFSYVSYVQGDCKLSRYMYLSEFYYKQPMGEGKVTTNTIENPKWSYPPPDSMNEYLLEQVCDSVN